jgi:hypothetical protein
MLFHTFWGYKNKPIVPRLSNSLYYKELDKPIFCRDYRCALARYLLYKEYERFDHPKKQVPFSPPWGDYFGAPRFAGNQDRGP